ncbi:MAG: sodium:proton antiporter, partial [Opitutales bacterium]|nr:sodium:proton antiporter [Opitutales bacterium]
LSGFLDNTPTYANFFDLIRSIVPEDVPADKQVSWMTNPENSGYNLLVVAISLGSVFFGALTYIGNGPNFMVKSIAETEKVKMPTFFGYVFRFSLPVLVPVLVLCGWIFLS